MKSKYSSFEKYNVEKTVTYLDIELNHLLGIRIMLPLPFSLKDFQCQYLFVLLLILLAHAKKIKFRSFKDHRRPYI